MKTKALISFVVTAKLICVFVFAYAKSRFSHDAAHMVKMCDEGPISAMLRDNLCTWLKACSDKDRTVQTQKIAIGLKIRIKQEEGLNRI